MLFKFVIGENKNKISDLQVKKNINIMQNGKRDLSLKYDDETRLDLDIRNEETLVA